jgi:methyltransferase, FkbM family
MPNSLPEPRHRVRETARWLLVHTPAFRGKGRITLALDRVLTNTRDPRSFQTTGLLLGRFPFHFDLRPWGQKFAYYYGEWERELIEAFRGLYSGGTFVDVGSSLGLYVVCMSDVVRAAGGKIVSIEPVPQNLGRQKENVVLNGIADLVEYIPFCIGAERGLVHLVTDEVGGDNNAFIATTGGLACDVVPLDELADERGWPRIGAIKIDVEGYDPLVIEGARRCIERDRPVILAELNRERMAINGLSIDRTWTLFRELRYHAFRIERGTLCPLSEPAAHENLFFVPEEMGR